MREYLALPRWRRLLYRLHHEPVIMGCWCSPWEGWLYDFAVQHRWPYVAQRWWTAERRSVYWTNVALAVVLMILAFTGGMRALLLVHRQCERRFAAAALEGSSYLRDATRRGGARAERRPTRRGGARVEPRLARRGAG